MKAMQELMTNCLMVPPWGISVRPHWGVRSYWFPSLKCLEHLTMSVFFITSTPASRRSEMRCLFAYTSLMMIK
uniref:Uncharacterized protein n=1 Tax=Lepeophtheirus salmonis TaxID=72036 RepID=A0A0K2T6E4_LEPSM